MQNMKARDEAILDLVANDSRFTKFGEVIKAAGLDTKLSDARNLTVFAPTNSAFAKLPEDRLKDLMKPENRVQLTQLASLHIFAGKLSAEDLKKATAIKTETGREIKVEVSPDLKDIKLANAKVILPKAEAANGFIYPLDAVLQPSTSAAATA